jgi:HAD superfamily hydrolase (TIGR01509 family)
MPIEAVIFDLDGTLASFNLDYKTLRAEVKDYLQKRGVPASVLSQRESIFEMLNKAEIYFKNASKSDEVFIEVQKEALAIAEKFEFEAASCTSLLPGALETLKSLKRMNIKIGLCTINSQKAASFILKRFQIADFFNAVVTRDMVRNVKPNPEHFETALKILGVRPQSALVVGDSNMDMQSAKELKAIAVGIPTGMATLEQLTHNGANFIITQVNDLTCLVEKINKGLQEAKP